MKDNILAHVDECLKSLELQAKHLSKLREAVLAKNEEIEKLNIHIRKLKDEIANVTLDQKYRETLVFIQRIDNAFRNLDANIASPNFADNISKSIDIVFSSYGYRFTDYSEQTKDMYDCEYQPIEAPNIVFRTVTRKDGCIAVKGKVFLPEKF